jgi:hypothetical protein
MFAFLQTILFFLFDFLHELSSIHELSNLLLAFEVLDVYQEIRVHCCFVGMIEQVYNLIFIVPLSNQANTCNFVTDSSMHFYNI